MTPHTPGPWHANAIAKGRIIGDEHAPGAEKIQIHAHNSTVATVYRAADASLIKAAPSMVEVLRKCTAYRSEAQAQQRLDYITTLCIGVLARAGIEVKP